MSEREKLKAIIDRLPEYKIAYIANLIFSIEKTDIEEIRANNDGSAVSFEELLEREGLTYADL